MKVPVVGDDIYVPTIGDRWVGGLAKVTILIRIRAKRHYVAVEEHGASYRWEGGIALMQKELKAQFGEQRAYRTGAAPSCPLCDSINPLSI